MGIQKRKNGKRKSGKKRSGEKKKRSGKIVCEKKRGKKKGKGKEK